jgi:hypothetical protein
MANAESASATLARELPRLADQMARAVTEIGNMVSENRPTSPPPPPTCAS